MHLSSIFTGLLLGASYSPLSSARSLHRRECLEPTPLETSTCFPDQWAWGNPWRIKIGVPHSDELCGKLDSIQRQTSKVDNFRCQKDGCGLTKVQSGQTSNSLAQQAWSREKQRQRLLPSSNANAQNPTPTNDAIRKADGRGTADYWNIKLGVPHSDELCGQLDTLQRAVPKLNYFRCRKDGCGLTKISFTLAHHEEQTKWAHDESLAKVWPHVKTNCKPNWYDEEKYAKDN
ncbi:hypothetical protein CERZMDRAFT_106336 [Cercospora zeae-maydis SCOH1-5]|uniref:Uncharacterized protein n=1 Tax=Cercospora zeae-maydis SCOH1-5 TaxID=717836 RepID=A0A6A6FE10_9PEZI|nr:hypothetical protein CERZMDRAFT_106336 [Cercospora zeae-maydis SCOH1-5]